MAARRFLVSGRVQGVGFRWFAVRAAERLGVRGWVRNLPDGRVEATAAGDEAALVAFAAELRRGPRSAHVIDVASEDAPEPPDGFARFEVR
jgi:acylphosphatase